MLIDKYTEWLCEQLVELSMKAKQNCELAKVFSQNGTVRFQVNRRNNIEPELTNLSELKGPNDYSVPVLKIEDVRGNIKAIVFGYACHPTVLNGYQWSGDYPGFAQIELEKNYPEVVAMFFQGAGADQNPLPRRSISLAKQYGKELAAAVEQVISEPMQELHSEIATIYTEILLDFDSIPTERELRENEKEMTGYEKKWAESMLAKLKRKGSLPTSYSYPIQVWRLGNQVIICLGGEVLISYAIRLKKMLGENIFVMGYSNDVTGYIPPDSELLTKRGEEIQSSHFEFDLPSKWKLGTEDAILKEVLSLIRLIGMLTKPESITNF
jgi:hypothetical protein